MIIVMQVMMLIMMTKIGVIGDLDLDHDDDAGEDSIDDRRVDAAL